MNIDRAECDDGKDLLESDTNQVESILFVQVYVLIYSFVQFCASRGWQVSKKCGLGSPITIFMTLHPTVNAAIPTQ